MARERPPRRFYHPPDERLNVQRSLSSSMPSHCLCPRMPADSVALGGFETLPYVRHSGVKEQNTGWADKLIGLLQYRAQGAEEPWLGRHDR
jgi:hypothetical protein